MIFPSQSRLSLGDLPDPDFPSVFASAPAESLAVNNDLGRVKSRWPQG
ncbi:hypothetical protein [Microbulbifer spongiae]|uniref:Uncharacterized protein n=1 Tax=Microbulbifer spongiae TaxID=2944933 RepID=A0ABY9EBT7_9GAMM|nr:hypothetical protein [Microbulbifer sp. MI-G]WKD49548.1 hypothetical protein M8T91_16885 [Microbulbifer sp. MI-G]